MSLRIVIRADAGPSIGGGHAYRTAVLGERLQMQGAEVVYATRSESRAWNPTDLDSFYLTPSRLSRSQSTLKKHSASSISSFSIITIGV